MSDASDDEILKHFLHAQQVGAVVGYHTAGVTLAVIPVVYTVRRNIQADIERHHFQRLSVLCGGLALAAAKEQNAAKTKE